VGTLRREDFQLFDKGKQQAISKFSIEESGGQRIARLSVAETELTPHEAAAKAAHLDTAPVIAPDHFVALAFEDIQSGFADLSYSRAAAQKFITSGLTPADRVAVFTTSGQTIADFTDDRDLLNQTLTKLKPHPMPPSPAFCPSMSSPEAYRIMDLGDEVLWHRKVLEARNCTQSEEGAEAMVDSTSKMVNHMSEERVLRIFDALKAMIRRMAQMPGQRTLILASSGFIRPFAQLQAESSLIDLAIRSGVVINTLDARGLYTTAPKAETRSGLLCR
jgi:VWFA-related protein